MKIERSPMYGKKTVSVYFVQRKCTSCYLKCSYYCSSVATNLIKKYPSATQVLIHALLTTYAVETLKDFNNVSYSNNNTESHAITADQSNSSFYISTLYTNINCIDIRAYANYLGYKIDFNIFSGIWKGYVKMLKLNIHPYVGLLYMFKTLLY